jgi:hypothetical protein
LATLLDVVPALYIERTALIVGLIILILLWLHIRNVNKRLDELTRTLLKKETNAPLAKSEYKKNKDDNDLLHQELEGITAELKAFLSGK